MFARPEPTQRHNGAGAIRARNRAAGVLGLLGCALALSGAWAQGAQAYGLSISTSSSRSGAATLAGQTYQKTSTIYVFTTPSTGIKKVTYYFNNPSMNKPPRSEEHLAQYDFNGTAANGTAIGYALSHHTPGATLTITAKVLKTDGTTQVVSGTFKIASGAPPPPPPPPAPPPPPPSGSTLRFADEFNGTTLNTTNWSAWDSPGNAGIGLRRKSAFTLSGGNLVVTAKMVDGQIVSGGMAHRANYTYGRYEFRVRTERDPAGTLSGVIMTWPYCQRCPEFTENDIYETGPGVARDKFNTFIHYGTSHTTQAIHRHLNVDVTQWHTVVMDWRPNALKIYRDGVLVWTLTNAAHIPDVMHHFGIQLDPFYNRTLTTPVRMYVDYVRIYS